MSCKNESTMNSSELICPKCKHDLSELLSQKQNKMTVLIEENSFLKQELNWRVKNEAALKVKLKQREKTIDALQKKISDLAKSAEAQFTNQKGAGQAMERVLENILRDAFPQDTLLPIANGKPGADLIQVVNTSSGEAARIIFESKNVKTFNSDWLQKLNENAIDECAQLKILVTSAMQKNTEEKIVLQDGIFICSLSNVRELVLALRYGILRLHNFASNQRTKQTNKDQVFDLLSSQTFADSFQHVLESFRKLQESHLTEKLKMAQIWKARDKAMQDILLRSVELYTELKSAGAALPELQNLVTQTPQD